MAFKENVSISPIWLHPFFCGEDRVSFRENLRKRRMHGEMLRGYYDKFKRVAEEGCPKGSVEKLFLEQFGLVEDEENKTLLKEAAEGALDFVQQMERDFMLDDEGKSLLTEEERLPQKITETATNLTDIFKILANQELAPITRFAAQRHLFLTGVILRNKLEEKAHRRIAERLLSETEPVNLIIFHSGEKFITYLVDPIRRRETEMKEKEEDLTEEPEEVKKARERGEKIEIIYREGIRLGLPGRESLVGIIRPKTVFSAAAKSLRKNETPSDLTSVYIICPRGGFFFLESLTGWIEAQGYSVSLIEPSESNQHRSEDFEIYMTKLLIQNEEERTTLEIQSFSPKNYWRINFQDDEKPEEQGEKIEEGKNEPETKKAEEKTGSHIRYKNDCFRAAAEKIFPPSLYPNIQWESFGRVWRKKEAEKRKEAGERR